jgi:23S rRNA pseudouridine1911/1915/1917 synthase
MPCHPLREGETGTALELVGKEFPDILLASDNPREGGLVHRLDNDTSGVLVFARTRPSYVAWRTAFMQGQVKRTYLAIVVGHIQGTLVLDWPIAHHAKNKKKMVVVRDKVAFRSHPKDALTEVKPLATGQGATLVEVQIKGGRRHQIRVHLAAAGFPLLGDQLYGGPKAHHLKGQALHAYKLQSALAPLFLATPPPEFVIEAGLLGIRHPFLES